MTEFDRRAWMKTVAVGLGSLGLNLRPAIARAQASSPGACSGEDFWRAADDIQARELVSSALNAAKAQVQYSRATSAARRTVALLGPGAGREHEARAEFHFKARVDHLRNTKQALDRFTKGMDGARQKRLAEFIAGGGLQEVVAQARQVAILRLLDSDLSPEEAQNALARLDSIRSTIAGLKTRQDLITYLDRHLDELLAKKIGNPSIPQGLCILILLITSLFVVLLLIAVMICAFSFKTVCDGVFQQLLDNVCPPG